MDRKDDVAPPRERRLEVKIDEVKTLAPSSSGDPAKKLDLAIRAAGKRLSTFRLHT
jgi:hypothetical protein